MPVRQFDGLLSYLRRLVFVQTAIGGQLTDCQLIERYVTDRDELAFSSLVRRHGSLVFGVGRRILQNDHDAEDVFQATFVMLARKAPVEHWQDSVAGWLYRVAFRLATRLRVRTSRQRTLEQKGPHLAPRRTTADLQELYAILDQELDSLSASYRDPLLLCYLQAQTRDQAAQHLGWSLRTVERRLEQGLKLLRERLSKRGVELPMTLLAAGLSQQAAEAGVTGALVGVTVAAAGSFHAAGPTVAGALAPDVATLVEGGLKAMAVEKAKVGLGMFTVALALAVGASALGYQALTSSQDSPTRKETLTSQRKSEFWAEGATVIGRVVDHQGVAVANANVLMAGKENIIVKADTRTWSRSQEAKDLPATPSTRTNQQGEFRIRREEGTANRLLIIANDPLLWAVYRKDLDRDSELEIRLPPPGSLSIQCDLPVKQQKLSVRMSLESFAGTARRTDTLDFHDTPLKNPGKVLFEHLCPGRFNVERVLKVPFGKDGGEFMDWADRQLVRVESGKQSTVHFARKVGRVLKGRVRGLENIDLRVALVTIRYPGPEAQMNFDGTAGKFTTLFDILPINSDGQFTTDPIPPGEYYLDLLAYRADTPRQMMQSYDFRAQLQFTVPETGAMPVLDVVARVVPERDKIHDTHYRVIALDNLGKLVPKLQVMLHDTNAGYTRWQEGRDGFANLGDPFGYNNAASLRVIVRADGFASVVKAIEGPESEHLRQGKFAVTMHEGEKVELRFRLPEGMAWPKEPFLEAYFAEFKSRVQAMRQPFNRQRRGNHLPEIDFNMLNVQQLAPGRFETRLTEETPPFYLAIHSPGFLQNFQAGPFTLASVKNGVLEIPVPRPASLDIRFNPPAGKSDQVPFAEVRLGVMRQIDDRLLIDVASITEPKGRGELKLHDLAPGIYTVSVRARPKQVDKTAPASKRTPGSFYEQKTLLLRTGQSETVVWPNRDQPK